MNAKQCFFKDVYIAAKTIKKGMINIKVRMAVISGGRECEASVRSHERGF